MVPSTHSKPVAAVHLTAEHGRTRVGPLLHPLRQCIVTVFYRIEKGIRLALPTDEQTHILDPLSLSEGMRLLIAQVRHERHTRLLDGIVTATFEGRDEDHLWIGGQDQFRIEVPLHTYLHNLPVLHPTEDILVEQILRSRNALDHIRSLQRREVRQLEHRHHYRATHRNPHLRISLRYISRKLPALIRETLRIVRRTCRHQRKVIAHRHPVLIRLRIRHINQLHAVRQHTDRKTLRILQRHHLSSRVRLRVPHPSQFPRLTSHQHPHTDAHQQQRIKIFHNLMIDMQSYD